MMIMIKKLEMDICLLRSDGKHLDPPWHTTQMVFLTMPRLILRRVLMRGDFGMQSVDEIEDENLIKMPANKTTACLIRKTFTY